MSSTMDRLARTLIFDDSHPGPILKDFQTLLGFLGAAGLPTSGKYNFLPMSCLRDLDERLTYPARPCKERPQMRSFPAIQGLYMLLRTTGVGIVRGPTNKTQLCVNPEVFEVWSRLNETERYFNLLEAWLIQGSSDIWGEGSRRWAAPFLIEVAQLASSYLQPRFRGSKRDFQSLRNERCAHLALLEMFGLAELDRENRHGPISWQITGARLTEFGAAMMEIIHDIILSGELGYGRYDLEEFGFLQRYLQPHFPAWQHNLVLPDAEFRDGVYRLKVTLGDTWRIIAVPASCDLEDLAYAILKAYEFDNDHLFCFTLRDPRGRELSVEHPACDAEHYVHEMTLGAAPLRIGESFSFLYDFGDEWRFSITLEGIDDPDPVIEHPSLVKSHGASPPQYDWESDQ